MFSNVLSKGKIGSVKLENRFVMPAMGSNHGTDDGRVGQKIIDYYVARAKGGFGLIITEFTCVDLPGKALPGQLLITSDDYIEGFKKLTDAVHETKSKIFLQIQHSGRQTNSYFTGMQPVAPSAIPCPVNKEIPRALTTEEVYEIIEKFGDAAVRAKKSGFDGVEIHGAHGYLPAQFLSGYSNKRTDEFGGDLVNRARFSTEIIKNIKQKCGDDFPVIFRISGEEKVHGGREIEEAVAIAKLLEAAGADAIHVSLGVYASMPWMVPPANVKAGFNIWAAAAVKKSVNVPVIAVGRINDPLLAETIIENEAADYVALGRAAIADPEFPNKVKENRINEISPCIGCLTRCNGEPGCDPNDKGVSCMVNPFTGHESTWVLKPAENAKKVVIVGGGPGGLECAWLSAKRGHEVILLEKSNRLGGQMIPAAVPPNKHEISRAIGYYITMCKKYGVDIRLNTEATVESVMTLEPDVVVLATGGVPLDCPVPTEKPVVNAIDVLDGKAFLGDNVLIVGGGMVGLETAEHVISQNRRATIIEMQAQVGSDLNPNIKYFLLKTLQEAGVEILTDTRVENITERTVACVNLQGAIDLEGFDTIVMAIGSVSYNPFYEDLKDKVEVHVIGDAKQVRKAIHAIEEGARLALEI